MTSYDDTGGTGSTSYPSGYFLKPYLDENIDRAIILSRSVFKAIIFLWIFVWYLTGLLNLFPQIAWGYGFIWHVFEFISIPLTFIVSYTYYRPIINIVLLIAIISFILDGFVFGLILYTVIICYLQNIPANCINMQFTNILIAILSSLLFFLSIGILSSIGSLTKRINNAIIFRKKHAREANNTIASLVRKHQPSKRYTRFK